MFMASLRRLLDKVCGIDRNDELQHPDDYWSEITAPIRSVPNVIHFECRGDIIEQGAGCANRPRRLKLINVEPSVASVPGGVRKVNRLLRRGYYRSMRHAA